MPRMNTALAAWATLLAIAFILTTAGCADTGALSGSRGYCEVDSGHSCMGLEGDGSCQPCPGSAVR